MSCHFGGCRQRMNPVRDTNVPPGHIMQQIATAKGYPLPKQDYKVPVRSHAQRPIQRTYKTT
jgi:hypothetical protein